MSFKRKQANSQQANGKGKSYFRADCQKPANRNRAKIRNHRRTIARDVTDRLCRFKVKKKRIFLMSFIVIVIVI